MEEQGEEKGKREETRREEPRRGSYILISETLKLLQDEVKKKENS